MVLNHAGLRPAARRAAGVLGVSSMLVLGMLAPASAAGAAPGGSATETGAAQGMFLVGFDVAVARAHGFEIVTLPDGSRASVPADRAEAARTGAYVPVRGVVRPGTKVTPDGTPPVHPDGDGEGYGYRDGDCGESWVGLTAIGGQRATLTTGMSLDPDAGAPWDVHWHVAIHDPGGVSTQNYSEEDGFTGVFTWTAYGRRLGLSKGRATAQVTSGSFATTTEGWICFSYAPLAWQDIY